MNRKYNIQEFIDDENLVIKCDNLEQCRKVGKYLWLDKNVNCDIWNPYTASYPIICWFTKRYTSFFNHLRHIKPNQTVINFEDVIFGGDFILPEKWCVKRTSQEINDWLNKNKQTDNYYAAIDKLLLHFPTVNHQHLYEYIKPGYTEITFDQFKKYVLKEDVKEDHTALISILKKLKII